MNQSDVSAPFPLDPDDGWLAALGEAAIRLTIGQINLGHETWVGTCREYVARDWLPPAAQFMWDLAIANGAYPADDTLAARERIMEWVYASPWSRRIAEEVTQAHPVTSHPSNA